MAWELSKVEDQRQALVKAYLEKLSSMTYLCRQFNVSRKTAYKWVDRYKQNGKEALIDLSRAPRNPHKIYEDDLIQIMIALKLEKRTWGPKKILARLRKEMSEIRWPSHTRLYEILKEYHLVTPRILRSRIPGTHPLEDVCSPNDTWMADFKGWVKLGNGSKCEPLTITDGHTRYLIKNECLPKNSSEYVWPVYREAFLEYGLPNRIRTDNGPPFGSRGAGRLTALAINLIKAGVIPEWIHPGHPEENGRHERFHLTLKQSTMSPPAGDLKEQIRRMKWFQKEYNEERPHESLEMATPAEKYRSSPRKWDGVLRSPDYNSQEMLVRKVGLSGCIWLKGKEYFISQRLAGEYVGIKEKEAYEVSYGPVVLGKLGTGKNLERPKLEKKPIIRRG